MIVSGLPVGAFGGRPGDPGLAGPRGPVYQAGTLSGDPLATAAGLAVLSAVTDEAYAALALRARAFAANISRGHRKGGLTVEVPVVGPLVGLFLAPGDEARFQTPVDS